ncbi:MAG: hypothetical protein JW915_03640 [Chitinispirillaceae bacterium]|nr:hypothetical protein [Chitinispirillaceae bacterium]
MKKIPQQKELKDLLGPSKFSGDGYLGTDPRIPESIIEEDRHIIEQSGFTKEQLTESLKDALKKAVDALGDPVDILPGVTAVHYESRGKIPSPYRGDGLFQKGEVVIFDSKSGKKIIVTPLGINLIEKHNFFQGRGSRYRIEPEDIIVIFNLQK